MDHITVKHACINGETTPAAFLCSVSPLALKGTNSPVVVRLSAASTKCSGRIFLPVSETAECSFCSLTQHCQNCTLSLWRSIIPLYSRSIEQKER